jgi:phage terminase Nu1 subunit (DNA packaging protein)
VGCFPARGAVFLRVQRVNSTSPPQTILRNKKMTYAKTQENLADAVGVSRRTIATWIRKPDFPQKSNRGWHIDAVLRWRESQAIADPGDPMMSGKDSPALERYRLARAKTVELELRQKRGQLIPKDAVVQCLNIFASTLRDALDKLRRLHGDEAYAIMSQAIDDVEKIFLRGLGEDDSSNVVPSSENPPPVTGDNEGA